MLVVRAVPEGGHRYYLAAVGPPALAGHTLGEAPGQWRGRASAELGLSGEVADPAFGRVLAGLDPQAEAPLVRTGAHRLAGVDLVIAAPKSVSVTAALAEPAAAQAITAGHDRAVDEAVAYLERRACVVRRGDRRLAGRGLVAAGFRHTTSRAADPHLHTHVVVANLSVGDDGRWSAIQTPLLFHELRAADAVYGAALRHELHSLGLSWRPAGPGRYELEEVSRATIDAFSRRHHEVVQRRIAAIESGGVVPSHQASVHLTRPDRGDLVDHVALRAQWQARAARLDLTTAPSRPSSPFEPVTPRRDVFDRTELTQAWCASFVNGAPIALVDTRVEAALRSTMVHVEPATRPKGPAPLDGPDGPRPRYTTAMVQARRRDIAARLEAHHDASVIGLGQGAARTDRLEELRLIAEAERRPIVAATHSAAAAATIEATTGICAAVAPLVVGVEGRPIVAVLDPERMTSSELLALLERSHDARVVLVGERDRLPVNFLRNAETAATIIPRADVSRSTNVRDGSVTFHASVASARQQVVAAAALVPHSTLVAPRGELLGALTPGQARSAKGTQRFVLGAGPCAPSAPTHRHVVGGALMPALVPSPWLVNALGPAPSDLSARLEWRRAATEIVAYRETHGVDDPQPLGARPHAFDDRLAYRQAEEDIADTRRRLGLGPMARAAELTRGWER